ncbi:Enhancer of mRNA-decapping protein 3-like Protein [Tribolium castaneum]|uniref:Enhancer of mRNA-decapping protein 3 n=1 Tax=Tribolium castaneum TaxID=7070 RepID=D6WQJ4_TRICA|nr:PREDICTED: enhancer of mRNA-decapping protein 3 [Tribolium castaneum]EFA06064.2 Enhancer of mRNA-decapping protein 3-like Protein [Tribolium castaneum]|eukprot:XP_974871.1 PREDICTED: enhancer of mRNA-decapping protein 3 [Tribolium castaneum]
MAQWVGYMVSIKCADDTAYQGEISAATTSQIALTKAFCNGIPCPSNEVTIRANEIEELKLIDKHLSSPPQRSTITIAKPIAKRAGRTQSTSDVANAASKHTNLNGSHSKSKPIDIEPKTTNYSFNESSSFKNGTPVRREKSKGKWSKGWKDEECFGSPLDHKINKDFDFEKNLALFDKQAIWDEINNSQKPDVIKNADSKKPAKYRHDENVIASTPASYRQIIVPKQDFCEYVTDDGLIIPSISRSLRKKLWEVADRVGLTWDKRVELFGRAAAEISVQLLGGGHRLNPHNSHQFPTVVVLCGPHKQGAMGINAARQLASHGVHTIVYVVSSEVAVIKKELALYVLTKNPVIYSVTNLPNFADLIIVALCEDTESPKSYPDLCDWASRNRASILALDPPSVGIPGIAPKFSLLPVLPLPHSSKNGKLYLCNLGFPLEIFNEVGIKYKSPFGPKFVIPLHPKDD